MLALDYGSARTGVAISDPTGTLAQPFGVIEGVPPHIRIELVAALVAEGEFDRVVVGMPLTLRGEVGAQARETNEFVETLRGRLDVPVETYDERFTTSMAAAAPSKAGSEDARAAAHLLESWLAWTSREA